MATQCSICGKPFGRFERPDGIFGVSDICDACLSEVKSICNMANNKELTAYFAAKKNFCDRYKDSTNLEKLFKKMDEVYDIKSAGLSLDEQLEMANEDRAMVENAATLYMTTGSLFDGYIVEKYIDVICEEIIFKNSFFKQLAANLDDLGSALSFQEREMTGANNLISRARGILMEKFRLKAARMGANAILGIDFETSFGSDVVRAAVNGTAVVIKKKEDA